MLLVHQFLENSARKYPDKTALIFRDQRLTYTQVNAQANALSHALIEKGVKRGDRVIIWHTNSIEICIAIFAVLKAGGVFVVVNPTTKKDKVFYLIQNCRPTVILTSNRNLNVLGEELWQQHP